MKIKANNGGKLPEIQLCRAPIGIDRKHYNRKILINELNLQLFQEFIDEKSLFNRI